MAADPNPGIGVVAAAEEAGAAQGWLAATGVGAALGPVDGPGSCLRPASG